MEKSFRIKLKIIQWNKSNNHNNLNKAQARKNNQLGYNNKKSRDKIWEIGLNCRWII